YIDGASAPVKGTRGSVSGCWLVPGGAVPAKGESPGAGDGGAAGVPGGVGSGIGPPDAGVSLAATAAPGEAAGPGGGEISRAEALLAPFQRPASISSISAICCRSPRLPTCPP